MNLKIKMRQIGEDKLNVHVESRVPFNADDMIKRLSGFLSPNYRFEGLAGDIKVKVLNVNFRRIH